MPDLRYERKFRLIDQDFKAVFHHVRIHPAAFRIQFPDRIINNIYFDTPELVAFQENLAGISDRQKQRLRWYGDNILQVQNGKWETKYKHNMLGGKRIVDFSEAVSLSDFAEIERIANSKYHRGRVIYPSLVNRYVRSYFISADGHFRLTIDRRIEYCPVNGALRFSRFAFTDPAVIIEVKYEREFDDSVDEILQFIPYNQTKNSKYVTGMTMSI